MNNSKAIGYRLPAIAMAIATVSAVWGMTPSQVYADSLVDPTRPPIAARKPVVGAPAVQAAPRVSAIFVAGERRTAVFDGRVVKAGDRVGDVYIEAVTAEGVRYRHAGKIEFARLPKQAATVRRKVASEENEP